MTDWLNLDLAAGNYVAICYIPNPQIGKAHYELGMLMPFSAK